MTLHINRFVDRVRTAELKQQRDVIMTIREAQDLHADITRLLTALIEAQKALEEPAKDPVIEVRLDGSDF